ncbi:helix-turn-helix domain-containing protein [Marinobacter daepoensis]|uniref:helix-turn-helix domain-containing protein n=1 Tax=Marinobacter daepoensis TaxID=262077 RepID=UPI000425FB22|nr:helix-turn-helix transcriptional regulator [Marinobacter daepoensis]
MSLGHALRQLRQQKGLTLAELAEQTDSYVGNLSRIERDIAKPSLDLLYRISHALNFSMSDIFSVSESGTGHHDSQQVALNTIFISLLQEDRDLLLEFAHLLQKRSTDSAALLAATATPSSKDADDSYAT